MYLKLDTLIQSVIFLEQASLLHSQQSDSKLQLSDS